MDDTNRTQIEDGFYVRIHDCLNDDLKVFIAQMEDQLYTPSINYTLPFLEALNTYIVDTNTWKPLFLEIMDEQETIGIFPLMYMERRKSHIFKYRSIKFFGAIKTDYSVVICKKQNVSHVVKIAMKFLDRWAKWNEMILDDIIGTNPLVGEIEKCLQNMNVRFHHIEGKYYYIDITKGNVFENMGASFVHKNIKAALKRLDKSQNWEFVCDPDWDTNRLCEEAAKIHIARQHELSRESIFETESGYKYMSAIVSSFRQRNELKSFWLFVEYKPVAFIIGFSINSTFYVWTIAFNPESKIYYPGKFLYYKAIEYCVENNYKVFSFMRGEGDYKDKWTQTYDINHRFKIYNQRGLWNKFLNLNK